MPFTFAEADGREWIIDPEAHAQLAPLLTLLGRMLEEMEISRDGSLSMRFGDSSRIRVAPHPKYEAWEAHGSGGLEGRLPLWPRGRVTVGVVAANSAAFS